jgi:hypothetical protein
MVTHNKLLTPDAQSVASTTGVGGKNETPIVVSMNAGISFVKNAISNIYFVFSANDSVLVVRGGRRSVQIDNTVLPSNRRATVGSRPNDEQKVCVGCHKHFFSSFCLTKGVQTYSCVTF